MQFMTPSSVVALVSLLVVGAWKTSLAGDGCVQREPQKPLEVA